MFTAHIAFDQVEAKLKDKYGEDYELKVKIAYQYKFGNHKIDILFTEDNCALWVFKYKGELYMNIVDEIEYKDEFTAVDLFTTLATNAVDSIKAIKRTYD